MMYFGHIAGILKDPKNEWALIEEEHYSAKTVFLTQISILAAIPAIALYIGVTQVGWSVAGQEPVRLASSSALGSAVLFYFAMWGAVSSQLLLSLLELPWGCNRRSASAP